MALEKEDAKLLAAEIAKAIKGSGSAPSSTKLDSSMASIFDKPAQVFTGTIETAGKGLDSLSKAYSTIEKEMSAGVGTWRQLSSSGITFGNDVIGMGAAAKGTRMDLGEFANMVGKNSIYLAGFGGSINQGAVEFAKTSKVMFDQYGETTDRLRQMGLTNKDLNETLALQAGMIGSSMRKDKERDAVLIESATALATEMDLMAKMTGKSRDEQMESAKKLQADAAFNIKLEQATRGMTEKQAAEYKTKITAEFAKAEAMGLGQSFKETFTYGQVMSKQAANEQVMAGRAGIESSKAAQAAAAGNFEEASRRNTAAFAESAKNNKDASFQNMAMLNTFGGAATEAAAKLYMTNKALADNVEILKKDPANKNKTDEELFLMAKENAKKEQDANEGTTKAMVNAEQRFKDAGSVIQNSLVLPIKEKVEPAFKALADSALSARSTLIPGAKEKGNIAATEGEFKKGVDQYNQGEKPRGSAISNLGHTFGAGLKVVGEGATEVANKLEPKVNKVPAHGEGGIIQGPELAVIAEQGPEAIVPLDKLDDFMPKDSGSRSENMERAYKSMSSMDPSKMFAELQSKMSSGGLNLNEISKDISTTISGGRSSTVKVPDMSDMSKKFEASFADFNMGFEDLVAKSSGDIADAMGMSKAEEVQAKIDAAIAAKDAAYEKLQKLWNEGSDDELNENHEKYAEELRVAKENLNKVVAESMSDLASGFDDFSDGWGESINKVSSDISDAIPYDEFAGVDEAVAKQKSIADMGEFAGVDEAVAKQKNKTINPETGEEYTPVGDMKSLVAGSSPTASQGRGITMDSFTLGANGLPIAKPKSIAAAVPDKKSEKTESEKADEAREKMKAEAAKQGMDTSKSKEQDGATKGKGEKASTLDDVVKSLNALNTKMTQLISVSEDGHKSTAKAAKSGSANLYNK